MKPRNFYISATIDGRKTQLKGGPKNKDGGFELDVFQAAEKVTDNLTSPINIRGYVNDYNQLVLEVTCYGDFVHYTQEADRAANDKLHARLITKRK